MMGCRAKNNSIFIISLASFLIVFLVVAPYVHEIGHYAALVYSGCPYAFPDFAFSLWGGLEGSIQVLCPLPLENYPLVLLAGSLSTFIFGNLLFLLVFLSYQRSSRIHLPTVFIAYAFVLSSIVYFFEAGEIDLVLFIKGYGLDSSLLTAIGTPLLIAYAYVAYRFMVIYIEREILQDMRPGSSASAKD